MLSGSASDVIKQRAEKAGFDERYSLLGLILEALRERTSRVLFEEELLEELKTTLADIKERSQTEDLTVLMTQAQQACTEQRRRLKESNGLSDYKDRLLSHKAQALDRYISICDKGFDAVRAAYSERVEAFKEQVTETKAAMTNMFAFCTQVFGEGQELLILMTELAASPVNARFIAHYGCDEYYRYDKKLMLGERRQSIIGEIDELGTV